MTQRLFDVAAHDPDTGYTIEILQGVDDAVAAAATLRTRWHGADISSRPSEHISLLSTLELCRDWIRAVGRCQPEELEDFIVNSIEEIESLVEDALEEWRLTP